MKIAIRRIIFFKNRYDTLPCFAHDRCVDRYKIIRIVDLVNHTGNQGPQGNHFVCLNELKLGVLEILVGKPQFILDLPLLSFYFCRVKCHLQGNPEIFVLKRLENIAERHR